MTTTYHWEKKESAGSWTDFEGTPTIANPTEDFDAGTWDVRVTVSDGVSSDTKTRLAYVVASAAPSYTGPLDLVPGAVVAFGVRALSAAWLGGNLFKLRRDSDDAEVIYTADAVTGDAPVATIAAWIGDPFDKTGAVTDTMDTIVLVNATGVKVGQPISGANIPADTTVIDVSGAPTIQISQAATGTNAAETLTFTPQAYAVTMYDQSGNGNNFTNATDESQPLYTASLSGGKPGFTTHGGSLLSGPLTLSFPNGACSWLSLTTAGVSSGLFVGNTSDGGYLVLDMTTALIQLSDDDGSNYAQGSFTPSATGIKIVDGGFQIGTRTVYINGVAQTVADEDSGALTGITLDSDVTVRMDGGFGELLLYTTLKTPAVREPGRTNIADYYGITL